MALLGSYTPSICEIENFAQIGEWSPITTGRRWCSRGVGGKENLIDVVLYQSETQRDQASQSQSTFLPWALLCPAEVLCRMVSVLIELGSSLFIGICMSSAVVGNYLSIPIL